MKLATFLVTAILATGAAARADEHAGAPTVVLGLGAGFPGDHFGAEWLAEASVLPHPSSPVRVHAMYSSGQASAEDFDSKQVYYTVRGGVEARPCFPSGAFCFVLDGDLGMLHVYAADYARAPMTARDPNRAGFLLGARAGFDTGGTNTRFRLVLDYAHAVTGDFVVNGVYGDVRDMSSEIALQAELLVSF